MFYVRAEEFSGSVSPLRWGCLRVFQELRLFGESGPFLVSLVCANVLPYLLVVVGYHTHLTDGAMGAWKQGGLSIIARVAVFVFIQQAFGSGSFVCFF